MAKKTTRKPKIILSREEYDRLIGLAEAIEDRDPELAETMMAELERARLVEKGPVAETVVHMGSTLAYTADDGDPKTVTLVYPGDADIAEGKISVATPVGVALIGLSAGQSIDWTARNGRIHKLTIIEVRQPAPQSA